MKSIDSAGDRIIEIVSAAAAAEPGQATLRTVRLVLDHDDDPEDLAAALISDEI
jgi:hypothetical protein